MRKQKGNGIIGAVVETVFRLVQVGRVAIQRVTCAALVTFPRRSLGSTTFLVVMLLLGIIFHLTREVNGFIVNNYLIRILRHAFEIPLSVCAQNDVNARRISIYTRDGKHLPRLLRIFVVILRQLHANVPLGTRRVKLPCLATKILSFARQMFPVASIVTCLGIGK